MPEMSFINNLAHFEDDVYSPRKTHSAWLGPREYLIVQVSPEPVILNLLWAISPYPIISVAWMLMINLLIIIKIFCKIKKKLVIECQIANRYNSTGGERVQLLLHSQVTFTYLFSLSLSQSNQSRQIATHHWDCLSFLPVFSYLSPNTC